MTKHFRQDNTEGYSDADLAALNQAIGYILEANQITEKSAVDAAEADVLFLYDQGLRGLDLLQAYDNKHPWPHPPSYLTPRGAVR
jgi:hypothetical protein